MGLPLDSSINVVTQVRCGRFAVAFRLRHRCVPPEGRNQHGDIYSVAEGDPLDSGGTSRVIEGWPSCTIQGDDGRVPGNAKIKRLRYALLFSLTLIAGCEAFSSQPMTVD